MTRPLQLALVGTGALGSEFAGLLASSGMAAQVLLIDPDRLQPHNLPRSTAFAAIARHHGTAVIGRHKASVLADWFGNTPHQTWRATPVSIADLGWQTLARQDLLVSCTDSALSRVELAYPARVLHRPMFDAGIQADTPDGRVSFFPAAPNAACYLCGLAEQTRADLLADALSLSLSCAAGDAPSLGPGTAPPTALAHTAAALLAMVQAWQDNRLPQDRALTQRLTQNSGGIRHSETIALPQSRSCPFHEVFPRPVRVGHRQSFRSALQALNTAESGRVERLLFAWPVCLRAACVRCKHVQNTQHRIATVRRHLACELCGHAGLWPLTTLDGVSADTAVADRTPNELGLPPNHLYLPATGSAAWGTP